MLSQPYPARIAKYCDGVAEAGRCRLLGPVRGNISCCRRLGVLPPQARALFPRGTALEPARDAPVDLGSCADRHSARDAAGGCLVGAGQSLRYSEPALDAIACRVDCVFSSARPGALRHALGFSLLLLPVARSRGTPLRSG